MGNSVSKEANLTLQWQLWNMKRRYILERCIQTKSIPGRCDMATYGFSPEELLPILVVVCVVSVRPFFPRHHQVNC
jgi:hypothetical protein